MLFGLLIFSTLLTGYNGCSCNAVNRETSASCTDGNSLKSNIYQDIGMNMIFIEGGDFTLGKNNRMFSLQDEKPLRKVKITSFYLDESPVSNIQFKEFIDQTGYLTDAEKFGDSFVVSKYMSKETNKSAIQLVKNAPWWGLVPKADWRHPEGPGSVIYSRHDHPVVQVSWNDAQAFCLWQNKRLPTEDEWECACRAGERKALYPWGDKWSPNNKIMANIWTGQFPEYNNAFDGYETTNPSKAFPPNQFGLYDMIGNVWEWTDSSTGTDEKIKKGGSFMCHHSYCKRYRCEALTWNSKDSSSQNVGFRCAKNYLKE